MSVDQQQVEKATEHIVKSMSGAHKWQWEADRHALLSEFARDKIEQTLQSLQKQFVHQWDKKSIKNMSKSLKAQLGDLAKLSKEQLLFTSPATENHPAILAVWWPWGHGSTVSLRLIVLEDSYQLQDAEQRKDSFFTIIRNFFS